MNLVPKLKKLGFSENEAKVYLALLEIGFSTSGPIIKKVGLHRNIVYDCLEKLIKRGLASETIQRGKKHFRPLSCDKVLKSVKAHVAIAKEMVPALERLKKYQPQEIIVYEDKEGFQNSHLDQVESLEPHSTIYVTMAGGEEWYENIARVYKRYEKLRIGKSIKLKLLALETRRKEIEEMQSKRKLFSARFLPATFKNPAGTVIWADTITILVYGEPVLAISIKNKKVAQAHRQHFNILWKIAKR